LSVLGGVNALGPIGILVGPMIVAFLQTLLNILHRELLQFDLERRARAAHTTGTG
jgi:predicted PurR-regulated permease PerM